VNALGCPDVREVAPDFAFGILDGEARSDVMLHLDQCTACQRYVSELSETADAMVLLAPEAEPPPGFERRALDRIVETSRRRRWRMTKLVAVTAAAAAILSVVIVRIVDENRTPSSNVAAPAGTAQTVDMVGEGGTKVGKVEVFSTSTGTRLDVSVSYGMPDGEYRIMLTRPGVGPQLLDTMQVYGDQGTWSGGAPALTRPAKLSLVDKTNRERCSAQLPTA
jgi:predicted anti-sigma-YlaC factor YlaD